MTSTEPKELPSRQQKLPLFNPHMATFTCVIEADKVPPIDAQADAWFHEALALDSADIFMSDRDYKKIVQLTRQAAERHHWKAMLNLASLYVEGHDPAHGSEDAVKLVEEAMRLGIPAAYDRMGTYYSNGTGVNGNATRAYAFWQRAAQMGNPQAMAYLGKKLYAVYNDPQGGFWANMPVAIKMLECGYGQGNGDAAFMYALTLLINPQREPNREDYARAVTVLHNGTKFGSEACANALSIEFDHPHDPAKIIVPHLDHARSERYRVLGEALGFDPDDRFPNLDKVVPLPPAPLPPWNGDRDTLLYAARGVSPPPKPAVPTAASLRSGRHFLDAAFALRATAHTTTEPGAPMEGYWQPTGGAGLGEEDRAHLAQIPPGLYRRGEAFPVFWPRQAHAQVRIPVTWRRWETARHDAEVVEPFAAAGRTRITPRPQPEVACSSESPCPVTGTWQPWVRSSHPLQGAVNLYWRQAWLTEGRAFPEPERDWLLPVAATDITWHLMDASGPDLM